MAQSTSAVYSSGVQQPRYMQADVDGRIRMRELLKQLIRALASNYGSKGWGLEFDGAPRRRPHWVTLDRLRVDGCPGY